MSSNIMFLTLLIFVVIFGTAHTKCPISIKKTNATSYQGYGDNCYYFSTKPLAMTRSHSKCRENGGNIVTIDSAEVNEFLLKTLVNTYGLKNRLVWTGLILPRFAGEFEWYDRSPVTYTNLDPDADLNNDYGDDMLCIVMNTANGLWKSYRCFNPDFFNRHYPELPYVCEFKGLNKKANITDDA